MIMATREIREIGDEILNRKSKEVKILGLRTKVLIDDMWDTLYEAMGVGLAAPQVGVLKQIIVIDVGEGEPLTIINPKIIEKSGEQTGNEGCLSVPGKQGTVTRPMKVTVEALNENMEPVTIEGEGLLARALCHEIDHLNGHLYTEIAEGPLEDVVYEDEEIDE
jgi:peptide deformylase